MWVLLIFSAEARTDVQEKNHRLNGFGLFSTLCDVIKFMLILQVTFFFLWLDMGFIPVRGLGSNMAIHLRIIV